MSNRGKRSLGNHDFPFHDYYHANSQSTTTGYVVGTNNMGQGKDQKKRFVSKSTLIYCTEDTHVHFNNSSNVAVTILANMWYTFFSNIYSIEHAAITATKDLYVYFEGVLPEDCGVAEA